MQSVHINGPKMHKEGSERDILVDGDTCGVQVHWRSHWGGEMHVVDVLKAMNRSPVVAGEWECHNGLSVVGTPDGDSLLCDCRTGGNGAHIGR